MTYIPANIKRIQNMIPVQDREAYEKFFYSQGWDSATENSQAQFRALLGLPNDLDEYVEKQINNHEEVYHNE